MAINQMNVEKIENCLREIGLGAKIKKEDPKADGGYESVSTNAPELRSWELQKLAELKNTVPNSFLIKRSGTGLKLIFY